jgi:hypothetical protein
VLLLLVAGVVNLWRLLPVLPLLPVLLLRLRMQLLLLLV